MDRSPQIPESVATDLESVGGICGERSIKDAQIFCLDLKGEKEGMSDRKGKVFGWDKIQANVDNNFDKK